MQNSMLNSNQPMRRTRREENEESYQKLESCLRSLSSAVLHKIDDDVFRTMIKYKDVTAEMVSATIQHVIQDRECEQPNSEQKEEEPSPFLSKPELVVNTQVDEVEEDAQSVHSLESEEDLDFSSIQEACLDINAQNAETTTNGLQLMMEAPPSPPLNKNAEEYVPEKKLTCKLEPVAEDAEIPQEEEVAPYTPPTQPVPAASVPSFPVSPPVTPSSTLTSMPNCTSPSSLRSTTMSTSATSPCSNEINAMLSQTNQTYVQYANNLSSLPVPQTLYTSSVPNAAIVSPAQVHYLVNSLYVPVNAMVAIPVSSTPSQQTQKPLTTASVPNQVQLQTAQFDYTSYTNSNCNMSTIGVPESQPVSVSNTVVSTEEYKANEFYNNDYNNNNNVDVVVDDEMAVTTESVNTFDLMSMVNESAYKPSPPPPSRPRTVSPAHNNPSKGNFYISKQKIGQMTQLSLERFDTDEQSDEKLAFGYYKESVGMQINDRQIVEHATNDGPVVIINIDLHFKNGDDMYLIATENQAEFKQRVRWQISAFMTAKQISQTYGIPSEALPASSRWTDQFNTALDTVPVNLYPNRVSIPDLTKIPKKHSKRDSNKAINTPSRKKPQISQWTLKNAIKASFRRNDTPTVPVVVIKGKNQWIEWKKFVEIRLDSGRKEWIGISLRFYESNRQWRVECIDLDAGRIYYQHRLVGMRDKDNYCYSYQKIMRYVTIPSLHIHH